MKNYKYLFLLIVISILGCSNLEEEPIGLLAPEGFFKAPKDLQTMVNGAYGHMQHEDFWGRKFSLPIMLRSDMVAIGDPNTAQRRRDHDNFEVADDNGMITGSWFRIYRIIAAANQAIAGAELISADDNIKNPITAQAYFVRAFTYFHLVRLYGDIPYLDKPVTNSIESGEISKTSAADVYTKIIADLEYAKQWLPDTQPSRSIPSKATAQSYLALVHLTLGDYTNAYNEAKEVIQNEVKYELALDADFQDLFDATKIDSSKEPLFAIDYNGLRNGDQGTDYQPALTGIRADERSGNGGGWSVAVPSLAVYNTWDSRDYRRSVSLDDTGVFGGVEVPYTDFLGKHASIVARPHIAKYTRFPGVTAHGNGRASSHNYSMLRYAEVLLIAAEALNEISGGSAEAHDYVNRVRSRARNGSAFPANVSGLNQTDFRTMVLEERKWELAFEYKRWYDIVRRKLGPQVFGASGLELRPNFSETRDYLLPLPADELQRNPNLLPNNPGY